MREVDSRNPQQAIKDMPEDAIAFYYFDVVSTLVEFNNENVELKSGALNRTRDYYFDAKLLDYDEVKTLPGSNDERLSLMKEQEWEKVIVLQNPTKIVEYKPTQNGVISTTDKTVSASFLQLFEID
jgi:hypothetical protein